MYATGGWSEAHRLARKMDSIVQFVAEQQGIAVALVLVLLGAAFFLFRKLKEPARPVVSYTYGFPRQSRAANHRDPRWGMCRRHVDRC